MMNEHKGIEESWENAPLVSIVIPVYNAERTLATCLDSVFTQTYSNYEVILIDDGSSDGSSEICRMYEKTYPNRTHYIRQSNGGPATARNTGIESSRGKYIAFVDSDDQVSPKFIETMVQKAEEANAQMVLCAYWFINGDERIIITYDFPEKIYSGNDCKSIATSVLKEVKGGIPPYSWVRLTLRSVFERSGLRFQTGLIRSEDYHFWAKVHFYVDNIYLLSKTPLYEYIENPQSITHRHVDGYWADVLNMYQDLLDCLPQDEGVSEALAVMLVKRSLIALNNAARCAKFKQAKREILDILNNDTLFKVIVSLEKKQIKSFKKYRFLMSHHLCFLVALKYLARVARYQAKR